MRMAVRQIVTIPDPVLRIKAQKVNKVGEEEKKLAQDLLDTLEVAKDPEGAGIAATQIGVSKKMCVVRNFFPDPAKNGQYTYEDYVLINPKIVSTSKETEIDYEGCLSVPNTYRTGNGQRIRAGGTVKKLKIAFFGTSDRSLPILESLHSNFSLVLCVTKSDTKVGRNRELRETAVKKWAREQGVRYVEIRSLRDYDLKTVLENLQKYKPDYGVVADFSYIIPEDIIKFFESKLINIHFSLLPT